MTIPPGLTVYASDANGLYCASGVRAWCRTVGIDYLEFVQRGVPAERLLALDDIQANAVVERAHVRQQSTNSRV